MSKLYKIIVMDDNGTENEVDLKEIKNLTIKTSLQCSNNIIKLRLPICFAKNTIGEDCMFSRNVSIWTSDGHAIIDCSTGAVINCIKKDIVIGNHVWIGAGSSIGKSVALGDHSIVGQGSVVTKSFSDHVIIAGNPAKVIKNNATWDRLSPSRYIEKQAISLQADTIKEKRIISIIPARYQSSRFPGKPLALILGKPMIQWVYEKVAGMPQISDVYVATDDSRIYETVESFGGKAIMTGECACGTERVYQACCDIDCDIILNIQGDEPMIKTEMIEDLINAFHDPAVQMATLKKAILSDSDIKDPNIAKLITDSNNDAIYFSRSTIPYHRDGKEKVNYFKHIGIYGYTKTFLKKFVTLPPSPLEEAEQLEQLRAIENGYKIRVVETVHQSIGVDLPEHIAIVEAEMKK